MTVINNDCISRLAATKTALEFIVEYLGGAFDENFQKKMIERMNALPSARPEYEPVKTEDFAKTMSENTLYSFMAWYGEALELMGRQGFVICKKTMR